MNKVTENTEIYKYVKENKEHVFEFIMNELMNSTDTLKYEQYLNLFAYTYEYEEFQKLLLEQKLEPCRKIVINVLTTYQYVHCNTFYPYKKIIHILPDETISDCFLLYDNKYADSSNKFFVINKTYISRKAKGLLNVTGLLSRLNNFILKNNVYNESLSTKKQHDIIIDCLKTLKNDIYWDEKNYYFNRKLNLIKYTEKELKDINEEWLKIEKLSETYYKDEFLKYNITQKNIPNVGKIVNDFTPPTSANFFENLSTDFDKILITDRYNVVLSMLNYLSKEKNPKLLLNFSYNVPLRIRYDTLATLIEVSKLNRDDKDILIFLCGIYNFNGYAMDLPVAILPPLVRLLTNDKFYIRKYSKSHDESEINIQAYSMLCNYLEEVKESLIYSDFNQMCPSDLDKKRYFQKLLNEEYFKIKWDKKQSKFKK